MKWASMTSRRAVLLLVRVILALLLLISPGATNAQVLNFDSDPELLEGAWSLRTTMPERLEAQIEKLHNRRTDANRAVAIEAMVGARRLASSLITYPIQPADVRLAAALASLHLVDALPKLDEFFIQALASSEEGQTSDARRTLTSFSLAADRASQNPVRTVDELDVMLRDIFLDVHILATASRSGVGAARWGDRQEASILNVNLDARGIHQLVGSEHNIDTFLDAIASAQDRPVLSRLADQHAMVFSQLVQAHQTIAAHSDWLGDRRLEAAAQGAKQIAEMYTRRPTRNAALTRLEAFTAFAGVLNVQSELIKLGEEPGRLRRITMDLWDRLYNDGKEIDSDAPITMRAFVQTLRTAAKRRSQQRDETLSPDLKNGWRRMHIEAEQREDHLAKEWARIARSLELLRNPAMISLIAKHTAIAEDLELARTVDQRIGTWPPMVWPAQGRVMGRVWELEKLLNDETQRKAAMEELARLQTEFIFEPAQIVEMARAATPDSSEARYVDQLQQAAQSWLDAFGRKTQDESAAKAMRTFHNIQQLSASADVLANQLDEPSVIQWAAWRVPPALLERLYSAFSQRLNELLSQEQSLHTLGPRLRELEVSHPEALLIATLLRDAVIQEFDEHACASWTSLLVHPRLDSSPHRKHHESLADLSYVWAQRESLRGKFRAGVMDDLNEQATRLSRELLQELE